MIWLVGCNGMLGREVGNLLDAVGFRWIGTDTDVDITDSAALRTFAANAPEKIEWIVNCSAYTAVDRAEEEPDKAFAINRDGVGNLARTAAELGARLLHVSTDYVFDGKSERPYTEEDPVHPRGVYGRSKAEGEEMLRSVLPEHMIIRTAWLYGYRGKNFVATMLRLMGEREEIGVVNDQRGSPTYAPHLAEVMVTVLKSPVFRPGTYHYTNAGETTWHGFAVEIYRRASELGILGNPCRIKPLTTAEYPTKAARPAYSSLSAGKIARTYGISIPPWEEGLSSYLEEVKTHAQT